MIFFYHIVKSFSEEKSHKQLLVEEDPIDF